MLTEDQLERYSRQMLLPELGNSGQEKLCSAKILVVGAGGLGSPVLMYLAAAGVGTIGLVEFDRLDRSNLHRQILFNNSDVGALKGEAAIQKIKEFNPEVSVCLHPQYLSQHNALDIIREYDLVVDGSDNLPTRYLVNDACVILAKPFIYGAVHRFEGQVAVLNFLLSDGSRSATYRDFYSIPPEPEMVPTCSTGGVLGSLAGIIGSAMVTEAIKVITGIGTVLYNRIWIFDGYDFSSRFLKIEPQKKFQAITELINYESFCDSSTLKREIGEVTPSEANALLKKNSAIIIDVRESDEFKKVNTGGINIPIEELVREAHRIPRRATVIMVCKSGARSAKAVKKLQDLGFTNLVSLRGGLNRWRAEIDPELPAC